MRVVLGCGADHRRAADVDLLDAWLLLEWVQIADDEIDGLDAVRGHICLMARVCWIGE
jgi:hypothetical protein